jgi:hypothetical protein
MEGDNETRTSDLPRVSPQRSVKENANLDTYAQGRSRSETFLSNRIGLPEPNSRPLGFVP